MSILCKTTLFFSLTACFTISNLCCASAEQINHNHAGKNRFDQFSGVSSPELHLAVKKQNTTELSALLASGHDLKLQDSSGSTAVHLAASFSNSTLLKKMIDHDAEAVHACLHIQNANGKTPLHIAAGNNSECIELLLGNASSFVADEHALRHILNQQDKQGMTPLILAAHKGKLSTVVMLLASKANIHVVDTSKKSNALIWALFGYNRARHFKNPEQNEHYATIIRWLLLHGAHIEVQNSAGATAVHWATEFDFPDILQEMIATNKQAVSKCLQIPDEKGMTPLHRAVFPKNRCLQLFAPFFNLKILELRNNRDKTPLLAAVCEGNEIAVQTLLRYNANPNVQERYNERSALHYAILLRTLIRDGKKSDITKYTIQSIMELLMQHKANPYLCDRNNFTPIAWASKKGYNKELQILQKKAE